MINITLLQKMIIFFCFLTLAALTQGQGIGTTTVAEEYISAVLAAFPDKADEILAAAEELANPADYPSDYTPEDGEEFDFVVIGLGSAGSVVASRLSEERDWNILAVEAGGDPIKSMEVPLLVTTYPNTEVDWAYRTQPDGESCLGMNNKSCAWPRGKVLGGSSALNYLVYVRGNRRDYDKWEAEGCSGWGYDDVLPYFKKSEDMRIKDILQSSPDFHGTNGYLKVEGFQDFAERSFMQNMVRGMNELGYSVTSDYNAENQTSYSVTQATLEDGRRCSCAKAFLSPIKDRTNLKVSKHSLAIKILIDDKKRANGIKFIKKGKTLTVFAKKEIILSAGAINSPQLLMLSGIGPQDHLQDLNISVVADLPVGYNLQDHILLSGLAFTTNYTRTTYSTEDSMFNFLMKKESELSNLPMASRLGFINTNGHSDWPEFEYLMLSFPKNDSRGLDFWLTNSVNLRADLQKEIRKLNSEAYFSFVHGSYLGPSGFGRVKLKSSDPKDLPILTSGYFSTNQDIDNILRYYDFIEKLEKTEGLKNLNATLHELRVPECEVYKFASRDYRICSLRHLTSSTYHQCGTCKMGALDDKTAVVDPTLRVKGVTCLRVCDASVMPYVPTGNTNAPTIMIGEKGADLVKQTWIKQKMC